jgi:hypothetical protein
MSDWPAARCLSGLVLLVIAGPGCQSLHRYRPMAVLVRDAETKQPIAGAELRVSYPLVRPSISPRESVATTAADGVAQVRAAACGEAGLSLEGSAPGYLPEVLSIPVEAVRALAPGWWFLPDERRPTSFVVEMYAEPHFAVELILPNGFRGLVKSDVQVREGIPRPPGQRCFRFAVAVTGEVQVIGPPELRRVFPPDYRAVFADGTAVSHSPGPTELGLRPLKREGTVEFFVVGTQADWEALSTTAQPASSENHAPAGKKGGGRGGRHGRGNSMPSAADASTGG